MIDLCPDCDKPLKPRATKCMCGWQRPGPMRVRGESSAFFGFCEWQAGPARCHFPGSMSLSTQGSGPWYCGAHFRLSDPVLGVQIVDRSVVAEPNPDYSYGARRQRFIDSIQATSKPTFQAVPHGQIPAHVATEIARLTLRLTEPKRPFVVPEKRLPTMDELHEADAERRAIAEGL